MYNIDKLAKIAFFNFRYLNIVDIEYLDLELYEFSKLKMQK